MSHRLEKIRSLVGDLCDRDVRLKEETKLLDHIFASFPIPLLVWSVDVNGNVKALKGNSIMNPEAKIEAELFCDKSVKKALRECKEKAHESKDSRSSRLVDTNGKVFYMTITKRFTTTGKEIGYIGMAWDITSNAIILRNMNLIHDEVSEGCNKEKILELCIEAISSSRLAKIMLKSESKNG